MGRTRVDVRNANRVLGLVNEKDQRKQNISKLTEYKTTQEIIREVERRDTCLLRINTKR